MRAARASEEISGRSGAGPGPDEAADSELVFVRAQLHALELIATGTPLEETLNYLICAIENHAPGMHGSVVLLPDGEHIRPVPAPSIASDFMASFDGYPIGPRAGSCGTAMYLDRRVIASDITHDPRWEDYPDIIEAAKQAGLRSAWSTPVHASDGRVVGSFAMYYEEVREPTPEDLALADTVSHLCSLAIEHAFANEQLRRRGAQQAAVAGIGQRALLGEDSRDLMQELAGSVVQALGGGSAELVESRAEGQALIRARAGDPGDGVGRVTVDVPAREGRWGTLSVTPPPGAVWADEELVFLRSMANVLAAAIERAAQEEEMRYQALHDALTGLPNRVLLMNLLSHLLDAERREECVVAVVLLDLDNFKLINDSLGHLAGDALLRELAPRLRRLVRDADTVARLGGDEFVIAGALRDELEAVSLAERISADLARPFDLPDGPHVLSASIGVAVTKAGHGDAEELLRQADSAMYGAKQDGGGGHRIFNAAMSEQSRARLRLVGALRRAHEEHQLAVAFQPIVSVTDERVVGAEALLRWQTPSGRRRPVDEVIAAAEDSGLIRPIGAWVLEEALTQAAAWPVGPDDRALFVAINLSPRQLAAGGVTGLVSRLLDERELPPDRVMLEITETALLDDRGISHRVIEELSALGVSLALDDFGTGFSSLGHLLRYPIDLLKIDHSFLTGLPQDHRSRAIVSGVTAMAHELGKPVVAEGVENEAQLTEVQEIGCDLAQGYLLGTPEIGWRPGV